MDNERTPDNVWVIAYDPKADERVDFVYCPRGNAAFNKMNFELRGLRVEILEEEELDRQLAGDGEQRQERRTPSCDSTVSKRDGSLPDPTNPCGFSQETLAAMDDAVTGRNLSGPYQTVKEAMGVLEER